MQVTFRQLVHHDQTAANFAQKVTHSNQPGHVDLTKRLLGAAGAIKSYLAITSVYVLRHALL